MMDTGCIIVAAGVAWRLRCVRGIYVRRVKGATLHPECLGHAVHL